MSQIACPMAREARKKQGLQQFYKKGNTLCKHPLADTLRKT